MIHRLAAVHQVITRIYLGRNRLGSRGAASATLFDMRTTCGKQAELAPPAFASQDDPDIERTRKRTTGNP